MNKDYYEVLGIPKGASEGEIKKAYRSKAHKLHPDKGGDKVAFQEINEAYQVLSDRNKRSQYDQFGSVGRGVPPAGGGFGGASQHGGGFGGFDGFNVNFGGGRQTGDGGFGSIFEDLFESAFSQVQVQLAVSIPQAVLGDTVRFKTNFGDEVELRIPPSTQEGQSFRFRGKGQQTRRGRGDLTVVIHIEIPKHLSREQRELYEQLKRFN